VTDAPPSDQPTGPRDGGPGADRAAALAALRMEYRVGSLDATDLGEDPIAAFSEWLDAARAAHAPGTDEPHAMSLATADADGAPSVRTVLLKGVDERGFVWFTNYSSRKGGELSANPRAALNFRWGALERQVCVTGTVVRVDEAESDEYFRSRPVGSRIGAIVSAQSSVIADRDTLERAAQALASVPPEELERPAHWGGFRLVPTTIEFWQGRPSRLHDRIRFRRASASAPAGWIVERLSP
jgi:pyridoxamine 5'-phosphate oxidase